VIILDASVWVSSLLIQDVNYVVSDSWLSDTVRAGEIFVAPSIFVPEVSGALARRTGNRIEALAAAQRILSSSVIELVPVDLTLAEAAADIAAGHSLRGADSVYVALAARRGMPLVTWDKELISRASALVNLRSPY
jgi:predicted nucleic acid-binding protein